MPQTTATRGKIIMFLDQDERLLLFHHKPVPLTLDELKGFRDAGIKTVKHSARQTSWHAIEPAPGTYNWSEVDKCVELSLKADMKVILDLYWRAPDWISHKIEFHRSAGTSFLDPDWCYPVSWLAVNPFYEEACIAEELFLHEACRRYNSPEMMCAYAMPHGGERILPFLTGVDYTEQQCINIVYYRQAVFAQYYDELWTTFHPWAADPTKESVDGTTLPRIGNEHIDAVYDALLRGFPDHTMNHFITVFFAAAGPFKLSVKDRYRVWTGAQFVHGAPGNAKRIDKFDVYGLIMAHEGVNPENRFGRPGPREYERVRKAIRTLKR